ncbi:MULTISPECIES: cation diffusion facilitator family transporter [Methylocaldum]|jgi:cation diffusion facilitator family transporter|uniref:cation diffusion facilitator family transporter n=1 Tax=unclassified Methylocaldum TaxID=2622260 RepID=UPI000A324E99|nr:cation diffusion facilitator family transporter [Methylocaldum sp. RMAD-M]MBP1150777.1 cation diffusion facilitator family transporter [Methylocaldum sp. RMAD-M]MDV3241125.1 cation diffusion facilitator family transporter [Methylocaldum sp.]MVF22972.1 cation diffusion facilitator family transporter [Methylocaldum sp. BRCS4]
MSHQADSLKSIFFALGANAAIAVAKLFAAMHTGSNSMLAEAIHSFADCGNQGLLILGLKRAKRPPSPDFPLGYGKAIYFWSFIVALILFSMGGLFSIYEGIHKLEAHEGLESPWLAVGILVFSIAMESVSLYGCLREVNKARGNRGLWRWFRDTRQSELIVVLGEDVAALAGLVFALIAVGLAMATGDPVYDAAGSIAIGGLLVLVAVGIGAEVSELLIGQSVEPEIKQAIHNHLDKCEEVAQIFNLITLQLGSDVMVAVKAKMRRVAEMNEMIADINRCEAGLKTAFPQVKWVFFEPDAAD